MDKKAIKRFAIESRKKLIEEVKYQASLLGITAEGITEPVEKAEGMEVYDIGASTPNTIYDEAIKQRENLVKRIDKKDYNNVIEEVAYTWFNRIIAIRFLEVNDYIPTRIRVLSSATKGKVEPDIVTESPNIGLDLSEEEIEQIFKLKNDNELDELFRILFIKQCNKLNEILPELFEKTADYTELLLTISFTNEEGMVRQLIDNIPEEDFKEEVEIIGWLYQYYNTELKEEAFKQLKKGVKITKEMIPAATQLFTPDWIVRYMVENSLGRLWLEGHPDSKLKGNWNYYLDEAEQEPEVQIELAKTRADSEKIKPEDIKVIDPAMGSGHILVYTFDVLMQIYTSVGYSKQEAAVSILENNLYGLDIDNRAYQLAYFAVMMKSRFYYRQILTKNIEPQICSIQESNEISDELIDFIADGDANIRSDIKYLVEIFTEGKEYGSILDVNQINFNSIFDNLHKIKNKKYSEFKSIKYQKECINPLLFILKQSIILSNKYDIVVTNPPYMGNRSMNRKLADYLKKNFPNSKKDLFAVFIEKCLKISKDNGIISMITMESWMFLSSFEKLRKKLISSKTILNLTHMPYLGKGSTSLGINFGTSSFIFSNNKFEFYNTIYNYIRYYETDAKGVPFEFPVMNERYSIKKSENFLKIPGTPVAYWIGDNMLSAFIKGNKLEDLLNPRQGLATSNNDKFLRLWYEVNINKCGFGYENREEAESSGLKWFPYNKGGPFRRWYGNNNYLVNWEKDGNEIRSFKDNNGKLRSRPQNMNYYFKKAITWSDITSASFSGRYSETGFIFDVKGSSGFPNEENLFYILAYLNSSISQEYIKILNPTVTTQVGDIKRIPIIMPKKKIKDKISYFAIENVEISKNDWDSFETSWNFKLHPLLIFNKNNIENSFNEWKSLKEEEFKKLKSNEIELNKIFIDIYNVEGDVSADFADKYVSLYQTNVINDIKSFISYAVGCMLGRYSLDKEGLIYAGGQWGPSKYSIFLPDDDNIIPILDTEYFEDDIVGRFVEFVKVTFGEETLEENLDFIAKSLKKKGQTSREIIRNYFLTDFYKDHVKTYKKHPIYWQFDSGKNNGFKALIYMHRYEPDLVARVRIDYLHKTQKALETAITHNERIITSSNSDSEKVKAVKNKNKLVKQLEETRKYDEALAHIANQKVPIDLDDGVEVNYAKFQGVEVSKEGKKATKIDLLKKI